MPPPAPDLRSSREDSLSATGGQRIRTARARGARCAPCRMTYAARVRRREGDIDPSPLGLVAVSAVSPSVPHPIQPWMRDGCLGEHTHLFCN